MTPFPPPLIFPHLFSDKIPIIVDSRPFNEATSPLPLPLPFRHFLENTTRLSNTNDFVNRVF